MLAAPDMAVLGLIRYLDITNAVEGAVLGDRMAFERTRRGDDLKDRSRFIRVGNRLVAPLGILGILQCLPIGRLLRLLRQAAFLVLLVDQRVDRVQAHHLVEVFCILNQRIIRRTAQKFTVGGRVIVVPELPCRDCRDDRFRLLQRLKQVFVDDFCGIVRVEIGLGGHRQNRACFDVHHNSYRPIPDFMLIHRCFQIFFQIMLDRLVDREHKRISVLCGLGFLILEAHRLAL